MIVLREVRDEDLPFFWAQQSDPVAQQMAAVTGEHHYDRELFDRHWQRIRTDPDVLTRTVVDGGTVAGHVGVYGPPDEREVTYWIHRPLWGHGIATRALAALLELETTRPLYAHAVADNGGSLRVLERCGFVVTGRGRGFARARGAEVDDVLLKLG